MRNLTLRQLIVAVLKETKMPMTAKEVWLYADESRNINTA